MSQADRGCRSLHQRPLHASILSARHTPPLGCSQATASSQAGAKPCFVPIRTPHGLPTCSSPVRPCLAQAAGHRGGDACRCTHNQKARLCCLPYKLHARNQPHARHSGTAIYLHCRQPQSRAYASHSQTPNQPTLKGEMLVSDSSMTDMITV